MKWLRTVVLPLGVLSWGVLGAPEALERCDQSLSKSTEAENSGADQGGFSGTELALRISRLSRQVEDLNPETPLARKLMKERKQLEERFFRENSELIHRFMKNVMHLSPNHPDYSDRYGDAVLGAIQGLRSLDSSRGAMSSWLFTVMRGFVFGSSGSSYQTVHSTNEVERARTKMELAMARLNQRGELGGTEDEMRSEILNELVRMEEASRKSGGKRTPLSKSWKNRRQDTIRRYRSTILPTTRSLESPVSQDSSVRLSDLIGEEDTAAEVHLVHSQILKWLEEFEAQIMGPDRNRELKIRQLRERVLGEDITSSRQLKEELGLSISIQRIAKISEEVIRNFRIFMEKKAPDFMEK